MKLGRVTIEGDLGRIDAGDGAGAAIRSLSVHSIGVQNLATQIAAGANLTSHIQGNLGALVVKTDIKDATLAFAGQVRGILVGHDLDGAHLLLKGKSDPVTAMESVALNALTVVGNVENSQILAGHDLTGGVNGHVRIGTVRVGGNWAASDLIAGILAGTDGVFGDGSSVFDTDDGFIAGSAPGIVSKIAKVVIAGQIIGSGLPDEHFAIEAPALGIVSIGGSKLESFPAYLNPAQERFGDLTIRAF